MGLGTKGDYWILDGRSKCYDLKEEIKNWGGYWLPQFKAWRIDDISTEENPYKLFKNAGLILQRCEEK